MNAIEASKPSLEELKHYGVKGMRWGVRKKDVKRTEKRAQKAESKARAKNLKAANARVGRNRALNKAIEANLKANEFRTEADLTRMDYEERVAVRRQRVVLGAKVAVAAAPMASRVGMRYLTVQAQRRNDPVEKNIRIARRQYRKGQRHLRRLENERKISYGFKLRELDIDMSNLTEPPKLTGKPIIDDSYYD